MKLLQETTEWKLPTPNHIYIFDGSSSKIAGYIKEGTKVAIKFSTPLGFDTRGRSFVEVKKSEYDLSALS